VVFWIEEGALHHHEASEADLRVTGDRETSSAGSASVIPEPANVRPIKAG